MDSYPIFGKDNGLASLNRDSNTVNCIVFIEYFKDESKLTKFDTAGEAIYKSKRTHNSYIKTKCIHIHFRIRGSM